MPNALATGPFGSAISSRFFRSSGIPVIRGGNLSTNSEVRLLDEGLAFLDPAKAAEFTRSVVRRGDLVFTSWGTINQIGLIDDSAAYDHYVISNKQMKFTPDSSKASTEFLYYLFSTPAMQRVILSGVVGTGVPGFNLTRLRSLRFLVPPLGEQQAIADAIGEADSLVAGFKSLIAKKRDVKQGIMQELLTGRTRLPGFTGDWREVSLGEHVTYVRTIALSRDQLDHESPLRYLHYGDIHTRNSVLLDAVTESMPRAASHLAARAGRLAVGDLVFADASEDSDGVGKSVEISDVPPEGIVPGLHTIAARFDKSVLADGFKAYLQFIPAFRAALLRLAAGTKVLATTRSYISSIVLPLPGVEEQHAIATVLQDVGAEIEALERRLESARVMKVGMMQELLTGRIPPPVTEEA